MLTDTAVVSDPVIVPSYACVVVLRSRRGVVKALIMETEMKIGRNAGQRLFQFPGGTEELVDNGNPLKIASGELEEETGFRYKWKHHADPPLLNLEILPDGHHKYFYLMWRSWCEGSIRTTIREDTRKTLFPPQWVDYKFLVNHLCDSQRGLLIKLYPLMNL